MIWKLKKTRNGNQLSKWLRPVFEHKRIKTILGANLAGAMVVIGAVASPLGAYETLGQVESPVINDAEIVVVTNNHGEDWQMPVKTIGVSQGFSTLHPALDLRAPLGSEVKPITGGKVEQVIHGQFGYGFHIVLSHDEGQESLYAHLAEVLVKEGQMVAKDTVIGTVGLTGKTTGPHLHLEIIDQGRRINPLSLLN